MIYVLIEIKIRLEFGRLISIKNQIIVVDLRRLINYNSDLDLNTLD